MSGNFKQVQVFNIEPILGGSICVLLSNEKMAGGLRRFRQVITDAYMGHAKKCYAVTLFS